MLLHLSYLYPSFQFILFPFWMLLCLFSCAFFPNTHGLFNYKDTKQNVVIKKNWPVKGLCGSYCLLWVLSFYASNYSRSSLFHYLLLLSCFCFLRRHLSFISFPIFSSSMLISHLFYLYWRMRNDCFLLMFRRTRTGWRRARVRTWRPGPGLGWPPLAATTHTTTLRSPLMGEQIGAKAGLLFGDGVPYWHRS